MGGATETILTALGEDWLEQGWAEYSFRHPTFPGDQLTVRATLDEDSPVASWTVEMVNQEDSPACQARWTWEISLESRIHSPEHNRSNR
ncbi:MAG: hypothetical protein Ct9H300mP11_29640 [Chloroflexota bacterium]|nr:MAG: hypothetical protein Ct9H300mP11_29640 [Chloroflexota bacterium]